MDSNQAAAYIVLSTVSALEATINDKINIYCFYIMLYQNKDFEILRQSKSHRFLSFGVRLRPLIFHERVFIDQDAPSHPPIAQAYQMDTSKYQADHLLPVKQIYFQKEIESAFISTIGAFFILLSTGVNSDWPTTGSFDWATK